MHGKLEDKALRKDQRDDERRRLFLAASASQTDATCGVDVLNLSTSGMLIRTHGQLDLQEPLTVVLPEVGERKAMIVWVAENLYGCLFEEPISTGDVSAVVLLAGPPQGSDQLVRPEGATPVMHGDSFGARLKELRSASPYTMVELAAAVGVTKPTLWKWETGQVRPREDALQKLAEVLGVAPVELLYGADKRTPTQEPTEVAATSDAEPETLAQLIVRTRNEIAARAGTDPSKVKVEIDWD